MAYENRNAAYDLSLFDQASAAPLPKRDEEVEKVKEPKKKTGKKVISLPEERRCCSGWRRTHWGWWRR